jgi:hypothetical protein
MSAAAPEATRLMSWMPGGNGILTNLGVVMVSDQVELRDV